MSQSPPLEATGEHRAIGATAPGQGIKGEMATDGEQRKQYFDKGNTNVSDTQQSSHAGASIEAAASAASDSVDRVTTKYQEDKDRRF